MNESKRGTAGWVDPDDAPDLSGADPARAIWRIGGNVVPEAAGRAAFQAAVRSGTRKCKISIALDPDVLAFYREQAGERGYQTLINATLREAMRGQQLEEIVRRAIREELHAAP
ncbi:uncharacterized protein E1O_12710 [Burkholderiales bacterium GJ-E10]|nr:uncharacterized protein E1O_12710 [Burkholderiales bacterium GJ-E10]